MFPDKPPFHYKCTNCGNIFTADKKLNAPSGLSLDFDNNTEIDENGNVKINRKSEKKDGVFKRVLKKLLYPKCNEHAVVSVEYIVHK